MVAGVMVTSMTDIMHLWGYRRRHNPKDPFSNGSSVCGPVSVQETVNRDFVRTAQADSSLMTRRYTVVEEGTVSPSRWDGWLESSPGGGHILQSYEWGEFKRELNWEPVRVVLERDGQVAGLGQFLLYDTPLVPGTLMYCTKGPWLPWGDEE